MLCKEGKSCLELQIFKYKSVDKKFNVHQFTKVRGIIYKNVLKKS